FSQSAGVVGHQRPSAPVSAASATGGGVGLASGEGVMEGDGAADADSEGEGEGLSLTVGSPSPPRVRAQNTATPAMAATTAMMAIVAPETPFLSWAACCAASSVISPVNP